ncbi:uncharacterized protein J3R85_006021 [Psidium guajava]|nr:uncharacterized protein J3R85_006021 [Psidium guajava]
MTTVVDDSGGRRLVMIAGDDRPWPMEVGSGRWLATGVADEWQWSVAADGDLQLEAAGNGQLLAMVTGSNG